MRAVSSVRQQHIISDDSRYLTIGQVRERYQCSAMWIWRAQRRAVHPFPQPIRLGGARSAQRLRLADVEAWERECERRAAS
jgi:predicted DNA-binding transcriptional regulator AlpA